MKIKTMYKGEITINDCTELRCKNIADCEHVCIGFKPKNQLLIWCYMDESFTTEEKTIWTKKKQKYMESRIKK